MAGADRTWLRWLGWGAFVATTLWLLAALPQQRVDPENRALKDPGSVDADRLRVLAGVSPEDPVVLLGFVTAGDLELLPEHRETLRRLGDELRRLPGVVEVLQAPIDDPGLFLMPVAIGGGELLTTAAAVVDQARQATPATLRLLATGLPLLEGTIANLVAGERRTIVPLLFAVLLCGGWLFFRRLSLAIAALLPPLAGIAWTSGAVARLGHSLDPIAALLDPVLLTIGVAASVHFVEACRAGLARGLAPAAAAAAAAAELRTPALLATATTMIGTWSLATSAVPAVQDFGLRSAMGVGLTHLFAFLILPPWLTAVARRAPLPTARSMAPMFAWLCRHRLPVLFVTTAAATVALAGLHQLRSDNDPLRLLPADEPARIDHDVLAQRLGGVETFRLLVPEQSAAKEPSRLLPLLAELRQLPGVAGLAGPVQRGPEGDLVVTLLLAPGGSAVRERLFAEIERTTAVLGFPEVVPVGASVQIARDSHRLLHSLLGSLGLSLLLLAIGMAIGLRSWRLALLGLLPNLLPSVWLYGGMSWLEHPVSVATAMIGCTMLGLIVDNTLHLLHHYRMGRRQLPPAEAMTAAWERCVRPMTLASAVLMLGFLTAATSRLSTTVEFSLLATATIVAAWFGTAIVLPLLMVRQPTTATALAGGHAHGD